MMLINGRVWTGNPAQPAAEAIAIAGDRIASVGSTAHVRTPPQDTTTIDLGGRYNGPRDRRFRIEHAQHLAPADIPRFRSLGVIASMQPYHAIDDGRWADKVIGQARSRTTYAFRSLLDARARLAFGSDWYVAPPTPLEGIYAAVTRQTLDGTHPDGWVPEQKITVEEALAAYTIGGAYASFDEREKGTLSPGMLADLTVIDRDLRTIPAAEIGHAKIVRTIVGGMTVFP